MSKDCSVLKHLPNSAESTERGARGREPVERLLACAFHSHLFSHFILV